MGSVNISQHSQSTSWITSSYCLRSEIRHWRLSVFISLTSSFVKWLEQVYRLISLHFPVAETIFLSGVHHPHWSFSCHFEILCEQANSQSSAVCFHSTRHCTEKLHSSCVRCTKLQLGTEQLRQRYDYILHQPLEIGGLVHLRLLFTYRRNAASDTFSHVMSLDTELGLYKKQITT